MKQKQFDKINSWCKYNAYISYINILHKKTYKPLPMSEDFVNNWAVLLLFYPIR
jgi:hypothetical protein